MRVFASAGSVARARSVSPQVRPIEAHETRPLRRELLRPDQPPESTIYPGDDATSTIHLGAFVAGELVGIASFYTEAWSGTPEVPAARLRGMATRLEVRGTGCGLALVSAGLAWTRERGLARLWCNARSSAAGFYERLGFERHGAQFEIEGIGPHYRMSRQID